MGGSKQNFNFLIRLLEPWKFLGTQEHQAPWSPSSHLLSSRCPFSSFTQSKTVTSRDFTLVPQPHLSRSNDVTLGLGWGQSHRRLSVEQSLHFKDFLQQDHIFRSHSHKSHRSYPESNFMKNVKETGNGEAQTEQGKDSTSYIPTCVLPACLPFFMRHALPGPEQWTSRPVRLCRVAHTAASDQTSPFYSPESSSVSSISWGLMSPRF